MKSSDQQPVIFRESARLVWRHQRVLWWLFLANFMLAAFGTVPVLIGVAQVAGHSLHTENLGAGFDLATFYELSGNPEVKLWSNLPGSMMFALVFVIFALFLSGGILETYWGDRKLATREFFEACGLYFWRWTRLLIFMLIVCFAIANLAGILLTWAGHLSNDAPQEKLGYWVGAGGLGFVLLLALWVRLWFDIAQVYAVAEAEHRMWRCLLRAFRLSVRHAGPLLWLYGRIYLLGCAGVVLAVYFWVKVPAERIGTSFALMEAALLWCLGTRLWQRAAATGWYQRYAEARGTVIALNPMATVPVALESPFPQT